MENKKLNENEIEKVTGGFGLMEKCDRKCKICGSTWTEYHQIGSCWMTESICARCWEKRRLEKSKQKDEKNKQEPIFL